MGKRKSRAKPAAKKSIKLDTVFSCPFCNHGTSVECRIDMKNLIGEASCRICQENFSTTITALTEPIDIYSEWIDECERVNTVEDDGEWLDNDALEGCCSVPWNNSLLPNVLCYVVCWILTPYGFFCHRLVKCGLYFMSKNQHLMLIHKGRF